LTDSTPHISPDETLKRVEELIAEPFDKDEISGRLLAVRRGEATSVEQELAHTIRRLLEQLEAAQERLTAYETPGWINSVQKVMEYRQALRETWDDYAVAIDDHASEEVRKEARYSMLRRFSAYEEQGWLSNPASEPHS